MQPSPKPPDHGKQQWLWLGYGACLLVGIPWYRNAGTIDSRWLGMPLWGWVTLASCLMMSLLTVVAVVRVWPEDEAPSAAPPTATPDNADERQDG